MSEPAQAIQPRRRTWPAVLALLLLSPVLAEMLTGSTPPLAFFSPFSLILELPLYGCGVLAARQFARRRGLGWGNILLLGMAYGVLEEGLVVTSWFNPYWSDLGELATYGRLFDTSWVWATELTIFHAVVSITIPIVLAEILFPNIAPRPWLGKRGFRAVVIVLALTSLLEFVLFGFLFARKQGYLHPPLMYFGALLLATGFAWLGLRARFRPITATDARDAPGLWKLRLLAFAATFFFFVTAWVIPFIVPFSIGPIALELALLVLAIRAIARWARRSGWGTQHRLALATGVMSFFAFIESPLAEFAPHIATKNETGLVLANLLFLVGLGILAHIVGRRDRQPGDKT